MSKLHQLFIQLFHKQLAMSETGRNLVSLFFFVIGGPVEGIDAETLVKRLFHEQRFKYSRFQRFNATIKHLSIKMFEYAVKPVHSYTHTKPFMCYKIQRLVLDLDLLSCQSKADL